MTADAHEPSLRALLRCRCGATIYANRSSAPVPKALCFASLVFDRLGIAGGAHACDLCEDKTALLETVSGYSKGGAIPKGFPYWKPGESYN